jgi:hypothetical protein
LNASNERVSRQDDRHDALAVRERRGAEQVVDPDQRRVRVGVLIHANVSILYQEVARRGAEVDVAWSEDVPTSRRDYGERRLAAQHVGEEVLV